MREGAVDLERWRQLTLLDQMANIGAEVGRTFNARRAGIDERYWGAMQRAVDLFEATVLTEKDREPYRLKEVGRAKEEFLRIASEEVFDEADAARLESYFTDLAIHSRAKALAARAVRE